SPSGVRAAHDGAMGLALTALDWLHDGELRAAAVADFEAAGGVVDVEGDFA
ncbi:MAG TPA: amidohydrolase, partial [Micrococcales bacterium]|nr:amidohydrolase [Micrococcales bacterium]